jgi:hypothetical protein
MSLAIFIYITNISLILSFFLDEDTDDDDGNPKSGDDEKNPYEKFYQRKSNGGRKKGSLPNDKQFPCDLCEKATCYSTEKALEIHRRTVHGISYTGKS